MTKGKEGEEVKDKTRRVAVESRKRATRRQHNKCRN